MSEPDLFAALRAQGIDSGDAEIRAAIRAVSNHADEVRARRGPHVARRCMEAMEGALTYLLGHPPVDDMSSFEAAYDEEE